MMSQMMRTFLSLLVVAITSTISVEIFAAKLTYKTQTPEVLKLGTGYTLPSVILGEDRQVLVSLPKGYNEGKQRYPVIYLLDGEEHFDHGSIGAAILGKRGLIPESIIVGLPNALGMRFRDMSSDADTFRRFLNEELFPFVEGTFRTIKHRTVFGHSMAGNFTLNTFISHGEMFDHYIVAGPSYREGFLIEIKDLIKSGTKFSRSIYFTMGSVVDEGQPTFDGYKAMIELLEQSAPDELKWQSDLFENQAHLTIPYYSLYNGMTHGFSDYTEPRFESVNAYKKAGGINMLAAFFKDRAEKYKVNPGITRDMRLALGYLHVREAKFDQAVVIFENNAKMFPEDVEAVYGLGYGYFKSERFEEALNVYKEGTILAEIQEDSLISLFKTWKKRTEDELAK